MAEFITIARRFRGPPDSANGGYACGLLAKQLSGAARVRLHLPPPLEQPLSITRTDADQVRMLGGEKVVAEGVSAEIANQVPATVSVDVARKAAQNFRWASRHPFPGCFVCGPERHAGDGLCIFPGRVPDRELVAAAWIPDVSVCDATGHVRPEVLWAALDCPSWFGVLEFESKVDFALLGQLTARILRRPLLNEPCVVLGWSRGRDGRKLYGGAALYTSSGELLGSSDAVWVAPKTGVI
jgi:hypothetical protein